MVNRPEKHKDGTRTNYINHEILGGIMAEDICRKLKMSNNDRKFITESVANHIKEDSWMKPYDNEGKTSDEMICTKCGSNDLDDSDCWCNNCGCWAHDEPLKDVSKND